jgi:transcriptional regulator with XRE-family HTH domain
MNSAHGSARRPDAGDSRDPSVMARPGPRVLEESFGQRMRRERERRQITLESIAEKTKIAASLFEGLERDDVSRWPSGVFRRAFIRSYAQTIGLDPDLIAREFLDRFPDPALAADTPHEPARGASGTTLRLTMEDTRTWFTGGRFLTGTGRRWAAVGCDAATIAALGGLLFLVFDTFWMPFSVLTLAYYAVSILVLGNTPGVCLFAPAANREPPAELERSGPLREEQEDHGILRALIAARQMAASNKGS